MKTLLSMLQASGVVPDHLLAAAQDRQSRYSGSLGTNLLELNAIHARTLDDLLAKTMALPSVTLPGLMADERPLSAMPKALQDDPMLAPLANTEQGLWLVIHPDLPQDQMRNIADKHPQLRFATTAECCFSHIWAQAHNKELDARYAALTADYIEQLQSAPPGEMRPAPVVRNLVIPRQLIRHPASAYKTPELTPRVSNRWESIEAALRQAEDRDVVTHLLQKGAALISERSALFRVRDDELIGMPGPSEELDVDEVQLPLSPSLAHALVHPRSIRRCVDLDLRLAVGLEQAVPCICAPVGLRGRPVLLLYVDRNGEAFSAKDIDAAHHLCALAASRLMAHIRRAQKSGPVPSADSAQDLAQEAARSKDTARGDTHPELPVLSTAEQHPTFWSNADAPTFEAWDEPEKQAWSHALTKEDLGYFEKKGPTAIEALADRLPGPLDNGVTLDADRVRMASALGPVPRLLVRLRDPAVEPVLRQLHSREALTRFVAALVFQELRSDRALDPLATLCFDSDPQVRRISARVMETYRDSPAFAPGCRQIRDCLSHPDPIRQRYAVAALGILRDTQAIEPLIQRLRHDDASTRRIALESLCSISGQQFGTQHQAWSSWYRSHRDQHRFEWLASSLAHHDVRVRSWAADELLRLTGFAFAFDPEAPRSARNAAIARWHRWWAGRRSEFEPALAPSSPRPSPSP